MFDSLQTIDWMFLDKPNSMSVYRILFTEYCLQNIVCLQNNSSTTSITDLRRLNKNQFNIVPLNTIYW